MQRKDFLILPIAEMTWFAQQGRFPPFCQLSQSPSNFEIFIRGRNLELEGVVAAAKKWLQFNGSERQSRY